MGKVILERAKEGDFDVDDGEMDDRDGTANWGDAYDLKKIAVEVHSKEETELNKDFTLSNINADLMNNKAIKFIVRRMRLLRRVELIMPFWSFSIKKDDKDFMKRRILIERSEYQKIKKVVLSEIRVMLVMSRATDGRILESFLNDNVGSEVAGMLTEPAESGRKERTIIDKAFGRNKQ